MKNKQLFSSLCPNWWSPFSSAEVAEGLPGNRGPAQLAGGTGRSGTAVKCLITSEPPNAFCWWIPHYIFFFLLFQKLLYELENDSFLAISILWAVGGWFSLDFLGAFPLIYYVIHCKQISLMPNRINTDWSLWSSGKTLLLIDWCDWCKNNM